jgi:hypothetical protein
MITPVSSGQSVHRSTGDHDRPSKQRLFLDEHAAASRGLISVHHEFVTSAIPES